MIVERVYLLVDSIVVVIRDRYNYHMVFPLQNIPNASNLIQKILAKVAEIDEGGHSPPVTDWEPFFNELKLAIEGTDIGE